MPSKEDSEASHVLNAPSPALPPLPHVHAPLFVLHPYFGYPTMRSDAALLPPFDIPAQWPAQFAQYGLSLHHWSTE